MDDIQDEAFRNVAARVSAQGFIVEILLAQYLKAFPPELRDAIADTIIQAGKLYDPGVRVAGERAAELLSDVTVRTPGFVEDYTRAALARIAGD